MPDLSTCTSCGFNADGAVANCPRCGAATRIVREPRTRGVILVICGLILVGLMGTITVAIAPTLLQAGKEVDGGSFDGTAEQGRMILGLFGVIIAFGLSSLAYGIYQLVFRRESKVFMVFTLGLLLVLAFVVYFTMTSLKTVGP